jgi:acyl-CoA reductase-like NAD-dependent aldehyde dehydrogenase
MGDPGCEEVDAAITAADAALSAIRRMTGSQQKLEAAGKLVDGLRSRSDEAARIRHAEAVRIYETESLSLAQLANRVGISKARADQIIKAERQKEDGDG